MADYSIRVLEFARAPASPACLLVHGEQGTRELPYSLTVLQSDSHTVLVDTGFVNQGYSRTLGELDGITVWTHPAQVLARIGVTPADVDTILLTHAHYDHLGTLADYPNAVAYLQERELSEWIRAMSLPPRMQWLKDGVNVDDLTAAVDLTKQGRLRLVQGAAPEVLPGLSLEPDFDTHTYGHQHVVVDNDHDGRWILPGDAVYTYTNIEGADGSGRYIPIGYATGSQQNCIFAMDRMLRAVGGRSHRIVPGHEVLLWQRHHAQAFEDDLHVAEVSLRPGDTSRLDGTGSDERPAAR
jgi:glyoxylase-like metal-dependent hydrolase (beta-lactamase superfamily II)